MAVPSLETSPHRRHWRHLAGTFIRVFEMCIVGVLTLMMAVVVVLSTIELGSTMFDDIVSPPFELLRISELFKLFGLFLVVLMSVELLNSLRAYLVHRRIHVLVVLEVALISVARRIILLEVAEPTNLTLVALALLLLALAAAYYFYSRVAGVRRSTRSTDARARTFRQQVRPRAQTPA